MASAVREKADPVVLEPLPPSRASGTASLRSTSGARRLRSLVMRPRILVADDDPAVLRMLARR